MTTLESLAGEIRAALKQDSGAAGKQAVCGILSKALLDTAFVDAHVTPEACKPRKVLYEDPELGFCICGHVYLGPAAGAPHDHGPSWAIYGLATGTTDMTDWRIVQKGEGEQPSLVEPTVTYTMKPGDAHLYDIGVVHSPNRTGTTKLIRIEGCNLDNIKRSNIKAAQPKAA